jgi:hypothetical protein
MAGLLENLQAFAPVLGAFNAEVAAADEQRMAPIRRKLGQLQALQAQAELDNLPFEKMLKLQDREDEQRRLGISEGGLDVQRGQLDVSRSTQERLKAQQDAELARQREEDRAKRLAVLHDAYTSDGQIVAPERIQEAQQSQPELLGQKPLSYTDLYEGKSYVNKYLGDKNLEQRRFKLEEQDLQRRERAAAEERAKVVRGIYADQARYIRDDLKGVITPEDRSAITSSLISSGLTGPEVEFFDPTNPALINSLSSDKISTDQDSFERLIKDFSPDDQLRARRIRAELDPGAKGSAALTIAETGKTGIVAESKAAIKGAEEVAKLNAKILDENSSNERILETVESSLEDLEGAFNNALTGPIVGLGPSITKPAQALDLAHATVSAILKQVFKVAGEGNFSDSDQKLLLGLIPDKRTDRSVAIAQKNLIREIVKSKISNRNPLGSGNSPSKKDYDFEYDPATGGYK